MVTAAPETVPRWTRQHWWFIAVMLVPAAALAVARSHALPSAGVMAHHVSPAATPPGLRHTVTDILFVPIPDRCAGRRRRPPDARHPAPGAVSLDPAGVRLREAGRLWARRCLVW